MKKKTNRTILMLSHNDDNTGAFDYFTTYLQKQGYKTICIKHPLSQYDNHTTIIEKNNTIIKKIPRHGAVFFNLFYDLCISILWGKKYTYDIVIGANNFDTLAAIIITKLFRRKSSVIFYGSDFSFERFHNIFLDKIYVQIDKLAIQQSNLVISNTKRAENARFKLGLQKSHSIVIPNGINMTTIPTIPKVINNDEFLYVGAINKEHGIADFIQTYHKHMKRLVVFGNGPDLARVTALCKKYHITLESMGIKPHEFVLPFMQTFQGWGIAPYTLYAKHIYYGSSLKTIEYLACGLPVILANVVEIATKIEKLQLGVVYEELNENELYEKIKNFSAKDFAKRAATFAKSYENDQLFSKIPFDTL